MERRWAASGLGDRSRSLRTERSRSFHRLLHVGQHSVAWHRDAQDRGRALERVLNPLPSPAFRSARGLPTVKRATERALPREKAAPCLYHWLTSVSRWRARVGW